MHPPTLGKERAQLLLSHRPNRVNLFPLLTGKVCDCSIPAPTWKRAPPAVHRRPSEPVCRELNFWLVAGSSCGSHQFPAFRGTRAHTLTLPFTLPSPRSPHPTLRTAPPPGGGWVTSGLQSGGERLERAARSSPRKLEAHWGSRCSCAPPSPLHPLSRCQPTGEHRKPPGELKVVAGGGQRGCCSPGMH